MRVCTVCGNRDREQIDKALIANSATLRDISQRFGLSKDAVYRHKRDHLPQALIKAKAAQELVHGDDLWQQVSQLNMKAQNVLARAEKAGDHDIVLKAIAESRKNLELQGKLLGEFNKQKAPGGDKHLHLHGLSVSELAELAETGEVPDIEPTESKGLIEVKRTQ